jgi:hypothetical protein
VVIVKRIAMIITMTVIAISMSPILRIFGSWDLRYFALQINPIGGKTILPRASVTMVEIDVAGGVGWRLCPQLKQKKSDGRMVI